MLQTCTSGSRVVQDFKIIKFTIGLDYADVYAFMTDMRNFGAWGGVDRGAELVKTADGIWAGQIGGAELIIRPTPFNSFGVLDVDTWRAGETPLRSYVRLSPNLEGCDFVFCHIRQPGSSIEQFNSQNVWLEADLMRLKSYLEGGGATRKTLTSTVISLGIARSVEHVYRYLVEPRQFALWAAITSNRMVHKGGLDWLFDMAVGSRVVRFQAPNSFGIADQAVFAEGETPLLSPMRVVPNGEGSIVTYMCFQRRGMSDEKYQSTLEWITSDFLTLQSVVEV